MTESIEPRPLVLDWARKMEACLRRNEQPPKNKGPWDVGLPAHAAFRNLLLERGEVNDAFWRGVNEESELVDEAVCAMILADCLRPDGPSKDRGMTL